MERGSDKHGPLEDEEMKHETRSMEQGAPVPSRVEDHREMEPVDEDDEENEDDENENEDDGEDETEP